MRWHYYEGTRPAAYDRKNYVIIACNCISVIFQQKIVCLEWKYEQVFQPQELRVQTKKSD